MATYMKAGLLAALSSEEYHADKSVSSTILKAYAQSGAHGKAQEDGLIRIGEETAKFGEAFHCALLEPDKFKSNYAVKPHGMSFATKEGKAWREANTSSSIISFDDARTIEGMSKSAYDHPIARPFLRTEGRCELSAFTTHEVTGLPIRARFDKLTNEGVIIDIKTTTSAKPFRFVRQCAMLNYHIQAAFYAKVLQTLKEPFNGFVFIAIEKTPPYAVLCAEFDSVSMSKGYSEVERLMAFYKKCYDENHWPGYVEQKIPWQMTLPEWCLNSQEPSEQVVYELEGA